MEEELISFETAKLAKEKGFDEDVKNYYDGSGEIFTRLYKAYKGKYYQVPTQSLLQKWLRGNYNIHIDIIRSFNCYQFDVLKYDEFEDANGIIFNGIGVWDLEKYEGALEKGLFEALKLIK